MKRFANRLLSKPRMQSVQNPKGFFFLFRASPRSLHLFFSFACVINTFAASLSYSSTHQPPHSPSFTACRCCEALRFQASSPVLGDCFSSFVQLLYSSSSFLCPLWAGRSCFSQCAMCHFASCDPLGRRSSLLSPTLWTAFPAFSSIFGRQPFVSVVYLRSASTVSVVPPLSTPRASMQVQLEPPG